MMLKVNPDQWLWLIISILAVWRLTSFICFDAGPFDIMTKMRIVLYKLKLGKLIDCFHCAAIWVSIVITLCVYSFTLHILLLIFAIAGGTSLIEKSFFYERHTEKTNESDE